MEEKVLYRNKTDIAQIIYDDGNPRTVVPTGTIMLTKEQGETLLQVLEPVEVKAPKKPAEK